MIRKLAYTLVLPLIWGASQLSAAAGSATASHTDLLADSAKISAALAADDLAAARSAATALAERAKTSDKKDLAPKAEAVANAKDIATARENFKALSTAVEPLAAGATDYVVMTCPMAKADWVQTKGEVRNPYYGKSMLTCGMPKKS